MNKVKIHRCSINKFTVHFCDLDVWRGGPVTFRGDGQEGAYQHSEHTVRRDEVGRPAKQVLDLLYDEVRAPNVILMLHTIMCTVVEDQVVVAMEMIADALRLEFDVELEVLVEV